jgi:hypothetical protein
MMLSNPSKLGLGDRLQTTCNTVLRTLNTMDKSVDKAESNPERFGVVREELADRCALINEKILYNPIAPVVFKHPSSKFLSYLQIAKWTDINTCAK